MKPTDKNDVALIPDLSPVKVVKLLAFIIVERIDHTCVSQAY